MERKFHVAYNYGHQKRVIWGTLDVTLAGENNKKQKPVLTPAAMELIRNIVRQVNKLSEKHPVSILNLIEYEAW